MQLPRTVSLGSMLQTCSLQGGEDCEKSFSPWEGGSLRRLPAWEKGLRSLLSEREIPEEGISQEGSRQAKKACFMIGSHNFCMVAMGMKMKTNNTIMSCARSALEKLTVLILL